MVSHDRAAECQAKLHTVRAHLKQHGLGAVRLRSVDWFSWMTAGGSSVVILTAEAGIAEVLVTERGAWILTDVIEAERLRDEELPPGVFEVVARPWADPSAREHFVISIAGPAPVASDRPAVYEQALPRELRRARLRLLPAEIERYRELGQDAAAAMTAVMHAAQPGWTEQQLAGAGADALWQRGIHPTLVLVAGHARLPRYRHPTPARCVLGDKAMMVYCGRRSGLYANLTRFVYFAVPPAADRAALNALAAIEAAAFETGRPDTPLSAVYESLVSAYAIAGYAAEERSHHQGGITGYLSREIVATPTTREPLAAAMACAWNPSVPGMKLEDTVLVTDNEVEILTVDPAWPTFAAAGRRRPDLLVRA